MEYRFSLAAVFIFSVLVEKLLTKISPEHVGVIFADPISATIAVVALGSSAYGAYAGERAASSAASQYRNARDDAARQKAVEEAQMRQDKQEMYDLSKAQREEQMTTNTRLAGEQNAALEKIRGEVPGMQQRMGEDLLKQQEYAYKRMAPQLENRLNALGLLQSGALPEAQARYQGDLENSRQTALSNFRMNAENNLNIQQPLANSSADIGRQSEAMTRNLNTSQQNLSQQFANQNNANLNDTARMQYLAGLGSANNAAAQSSANSYMNFGGQVAGAGMQYYGMKNQPNNMNGGSYDPKNPSASALYRWRQQGPTDYSIPGVYR